MVTSRSLIQESGHTSRKYHIWQVLRFQLCRTQWSIRFVFDPNGHPGPYYLELAAFLRIVRASDEIDLDQTTVPELLVFPYSNSILFENVFLAFNVSAAFFELD